MQEGCGCVDMQSTTIGIATGVHLPPEALNSTGSSPRNYTVSSAAHAQLHHTLTCLFTGSRTGWFRLCPLAGRELAVLVLQVEVVLQG